MPVLIYFLQGKSAIGGSWPGNVYQAYFRKIEKQSGIPKPLAALAEPEKVLPEEAAFVKSKNLDKEWGAIKNRYDNNRGSVTLYSYNPPNNST